MANVQDLTMLGATTSASGAILPPPVSQFIDKPYDPTPDRENIRGTIALWLIWTLVGVITIVVLTGIVTMHGCHLPNSCSPETNELKAVRVVIELVLTPLVGLVGAVTGFYFGEKTAAGKPGG